jgi:hypothetical protein
MALKTFIWLTAWDIGAIVSFIAFIAIITYYNDKELDSKANKEQVKKDLENLKCEILNEVNKIIHKSRKNGGIKRHTQ